MGCGGRGSHNYLNTHFNGRDTEGYGSHGVSVDMYSGLHVNGGPFLLYATLGIILFSPSSEGWVKQREGAAGGVTVMESPGSASPAPALIPVR